MRCATVAVATRELRATPGRSRRVRGPQASSAGEAQPHAVPACRGGCRFSDPDHLSWSARTHRSSPAPEETARSRSTGAFRRDLQTSPTAADHNARWRGSATRTRVSLARRALITQSGVAATQLRQTTRTPASTHGPRQRRIATGDPDTASLPVRRPRSDAPATGSTGGAADASRSGAAESNVAGAAPRRAERARKQRRSQLRTSGNSEATEART
ncbi:hypothetical protein ERJ75_001159300 [Trypanosoma vivax]|nr:hypothetical protein ERJ75_001159300 [Trypanosoma vivax]